MDITSNPSDPLDAIWRGDMLNRRQDAEIIRHFTIGHLELRESAHQDPTYVLNLDADWGSGKTFFLKAFKKHLEHHGHVAIYINSWEDDYSEDPFLTVVDAIKTELHATLVKDNPKNAKVGKILEPFVKSSAKVVGGALYSGGRHFLARYIGNEAVSGIGDIFDKDKHWKDETHLDDSIQKAIDDAVNATGAELLSSFKFQREAQRSFQEELKLLQEEVLKSPHRRAPVFVLIDELDRCRPSYAIELLERVKHIFSLPQFVFILGTDTTQLGHAVRGVYGESFDGTRYLRRFIDRTYKFQPVGVLDFVKYKFSRLGLSEDAFNSIPNFSATEYMAEVFDAAETPLRDIEQIIDIVATFVALWPYESLRIDIVTLTFLVYLMHHDISENDFGNASFAKHKFNFEPINSNRGEVKTLIDISREAGARSSLPVNQVNNTWKEWIFKKRKDESKIYKEHHGPEYGSEVITRNTYHRLLTQVASISEV